MIQGIFEQEKENRLEQKENRFEQKKYTIWWPVQKSLYVVEML